MNSITFTVYFVSVLHYLNKITPAPMKTLGMTLFAATGELGALLGNVGGGIIVDTTHIFMLYKIIAFISLLAAVFAFLLKRYDQKAYEKRSLL